MIVDRVFVNGRSRPAIMEDMQKRIHRNDVQQEKQDAIQVRTNMIMPAAFRCVKLLTANYERRLLVTLRKTEHGSF